MEKTKLQINLEKIMKKRGLKMKPLSLKAGLNESFVRYILNGRVTSPGYESLNKLAKALNISIDELAGNTQESLNNNELLGQTDAINLELFAKAIGKVDTLIAKKKLKFTDLNRAKIYLAWYDLSLINLQNNLSEEGCESQLITILKLAK